MDFIDLIANQLQQNHENVQITRLSDESGSTIEFSKRKGKTEYVITLEFDGKGRELEDVSVYSGEIIETIDHKKLI